MYKALYRLLRSFAHFFYFNCELVLFVLIAQQKQTKISRNLQKKFVDFQNFQKSNFFKCKFLKIRSKNIPWGHARSHNKFIGSAVLAFIGHKQTHRQYIKIYSQMNWVSAKNFFLNSYIFSTLCWRPQIFQTTNYVRWIYLSLKFQRFTPSDGRDLYNRKSESVAKT